MHGPRYTLIWGLVEPQSWFRRYVKEKIRPGLAVLRIHRRFVGFAKLRKKRGIIGFVRSVCPHGTTRLPLDGFLSNFVFEYFSEICSEKSSFIKM